jgi:hypothetical protein
VEAVLRVDLKNHRGVGCVAAPVDKGDNEHNEERSLERLVDMGVSRKRI